MAKLKFFLIKEYQLAGDNKLDMFKHFGIDAEQSAFASINDLSSASYWIEKNGGESPKVVRNGAILSDDPFDVTTGVRPAIVYSEIKDKVKNIKKIEDGILEVEFGIYPQTLASKSKRVSLNNAIIGGNLIPTLKSYTAFSNCIKNDKFNEYDYYGKKYILIGDEDERDSNLSIWIQVEPIKWIVDVKNDIAISKNILFKSPLNFEQGCDSFDDTFLCMILNDFFAKEIVEEKNVNNLERVLSDIKGKIVGQEQAINYLIANIYANEYLIDTGNKDLIESQKSCILLDGPTGTGKTAILKEIASKLNIPIQIVNASSFSAAGYVGSDITEILEGLYKDSNGNIDVAQRGIVVLDELDKLGGYITNDITMHKAVQQELLAYISGGKFQIFKNSDDYPEVIFDTTNLTFIGMGAFSEIREEKVRKKNSTKSSIGFNGDFSKIEESEAEITMEDLINYGLERELVGRFNLLISTKPYTKEDYKNILVKSTISPLKTLIELSESFGVNITYDNSFIDKVAELATKQDFGARSLLKIISHVKTKLLLKIMNGEMEEVNLTDDLLMDYEKKIGHKSVKTIKKVHKL